MEQGCRAPRRATILAAGLAVLAAAAAAAPPPAVSFAPPAWPAGSGGGGSTVPIDPVKPLALGKLRVMLESTELATVRNALGGGEVVHQGTGSDSLSFLCYTVAEAEPPQRVWLTSSELAGGRRIDGIEAIELPPGTLPTVQCPALPAPFQPARFEDGLWLGALGAEQKRTFGAAAQRGTPWSASYHERHGSVDVLGAIAVDLHKGRAVGLYVAHASQN